MLAAYTFLWLFTASEPADQFHAAAISPNSQSVAAGGTGGNVYVWNSQDGGQLAKFHLDHDVRALAFAEPDILAVGSFQGGLSILKVERGGVSKVTQLLGQDIIEALTVSHDRRKLFASGYSGWTHIFDIKTWKEIGLVFERSNFTCGVAVAKDNSFIATAGNSFSVWNSQPTSTIWTLKPNRPLEEIEPKLKPARLWFGLSDGEVNHDVYCADIAISADQKSVAGVTGTGRHDSGGKSLFCWNSNGSKRWSSKSVGLTCVGFTSGDHRIITGSDDGTIRTWDSKSGQRVAQVDGHLRAVRQIVPIANTSDYLSVGEDGKLIRWTTGSATPKRIFTPKSN